MLDKQRPKFCDLSLALVNSVNDEAFLDVGLGYTDSKKNKIYKYFSVQFLHEILIHHKSGNVKCSSIT